MVDYGYEELFEEHSSVDYIIVDSGATVTAVANSAPDISGEELLITNEELQNESIQLKESLCSESNLKFGKMEASKIAFSFKNKVDYPADLTDTEIDVYLYFNDNSSTLFKVGRYTINSDKYSDDKFIRSIVAHDLLYELNKLDITEWYYKYFESGERYKIVDVLEDTLEDDGQTGLYEYIQDQGIPFILGEDQRLVNGDFYLGRTIESDTITFEFFMQRILEFSAAFGHINRQGEFVYVYLEWYDKAPVRVITNGDRIPPTPFEMIATLGIGGIDCYDQDNIRKFSLRNSNKRKPNVYVITDSFVISDRDAGDPNVGQALRAMHDVILHCKYRASKATCSGDLCVEVGDRIKVRYYPDETDSRNWFSSYVLERSFSGIHGMTDTYQAKGDKKQPVYAIDNSNWHEGDNSTGVNGSDGVSKVNSSIAEAEYVEVVRNYGFRFMDEPKVECEYDAENSKVKLKWEDPADRADDKPVPCTWAKTYVVRREGERALNIYQGTIVKTSTTKNEHQNTWLEDTVEENKRYYYSIMPCDTKDDVRWTCCYSVNTTKVILAPTITALTQSGVSIVASYSIPSATYNYIKLVYKKDSIPTSYSDGTAVDITQESTSQTINGLTEGDTYFFVIFTDITTSEPQNVTVGDPVPPDIKQYVQLINGCNGEGWDFFWRDQTINFPLGGYKDPKAFSYYLQRSYSGSRQPSTIVPYAFQAGVPGPEGYGSGYSAYHTSKFSLWIVNESGTYKLYFRDYHRFVLNVNIDNTDPLYGRYYRGKYLTSGGSWGTYWWENDRGDSFVEGDSTVRRSETSLVTLMDWASKNFRNVNIYLNEVLISSAN